MNPMILRLTFLWTLSVGAAGAQINYEDPTVDLRIDQKLGATLPLNTPLTDSDGNEHSLREFIGDRPVILNFVYYECPMLCNMVLNGLTRSLRAIPFNLGEDYDVLTISIDPRESSAQARAKREYYLSQYDRPGSEQGWHFLTGSEAATRRIADAAGFRYMFDEVTGEYAHAGGVMVVTPEGKLSHYFYGVEYSPRDMRLALVEAADGTIGGPVEQILLLCLQYNPADGKYGIAIMSSIRIGGMLTLLILLVFVFKNLRRDRREQA